MLTAAVLAGGQSARMGWDKASLLLDGVPLLKVMTDRAASCADEVLVVGRAGFPGLAGVRFVPDLGGPPSSMRGLHAALTHARGEFVLLLPCDMPFFDVGLVEHMKELRPGADVILPYPGGRCEPLCALYRASLAVLAGALLEEVVPKRCSTNSIRTRSTRRNANKTKSAPAAATPPPPIPPAPRACLLT